jgi:hypothetical protein
MRTIIAIAALSLATLTAAPAMAQSVKPKPGADGYVMDAKAQLNTKPQIEFVFYPTRAAWLAAAAKRGSPATENDGDPLIDFVTIGRTTGICRVHLIDLRVEYDPVGLGHAVAHCIAGAEWHAPNDIGPRGAGINR